ncbi:MAG TPA: ComEC/Rec2 family competence protein, partial [Anaerolineae bacterium]|nr:ComEC/Rec2 family competence protein [Anaerolineae bacterium]
MEIIYLIGMWIIGIWLADGGTVAAEVWGRLAVGMLLLGMMSWLLVGWLSKGKWVIWFWLGLWALAFGGGGRAWAVPQWEAPAVMAYHGRATAVLGIVVDEPVVKDKGQTLLVAVQAVRLVDSEGGGWVNGEGMVQVHTKRYPLVLYGSQVRLVGELEAPKGTPEFDYGAYLGRLGIYSQMMRPEVAVVAEGEGVWWRQRLLAGKGRLQAVIQRLWPEPQAGLLRAVLLGEGSRLTPQVKENFRRAGLAHVTVVSGFHVAVLAGVLWGMSRPLVGGRGGAVTVAIGLGLYAMVVGMGPAVMRAVVMGVVGLFSWRGVGRKSYPFALWAIAAGVLTLWQPQLLWQVGFQLSMMATWGLLMYVSLLAGWGEKVVAWLGIRGWVATALAVVLAPLWVSLAAQMGALPLVLYHFGEVSVIGLVANLLLTPAQPVLMILGGAGALLGLVTELVGQVLAWGAWVPLTYTLAGAELFGGMEGATRPLTISLPVVLSWYSGLLAMAWLGDAVRERLSEKIEGWRDWWRLLGPRLVLVASLSVAVIMLSIGWKQPDGRLHVHFLDVGQGDATLIQTPSGHQILVDGGMYPTILLGHLGERMPWGARRLAVVVATHPDADHVTGLPEVWGHYEVGQLWTEGSVGDEGAYGVLLGVA